jgi:hypothetical protein
MKFLFILFLVFVFFVFLFGFSILRFLFGGLFGLRQNQKKTSRPTQKEEHNRQKSKPAAKKIINPSEGEYIDYEEIKD